MCVVIDNSSSSHSSCYPGGATRDNPNPEYGAHALADKASWIIQLVAFTQHHITERANLSYLEDEQTFIHLT